MAKRKPECMEDIEECKIKIKQVLYEYNCCLMDGDEGSYVLLCDNDTGETISATS
jgi:hypothetical protein